MSFEILKIKASEVLSECINDDEHFIIHFSTFLRLEDREHLLITKFLHVKSRKGRFLKNLV